MQKQKGIEESYGEFFQMARICARLGEIDEAFEWLERSYEKRESALLWIKVLPHVDSLRSDPRYQALLKKIGLN